MIKTLAASRLRYNRSRTILTAVAVMLTAALLMGLGTTVTGLLDYQRQQASAESNIHAGFRNLTEDQVKVLSKHTDVEAVKTSQIAATLEYGKMNGFLISVNDVKPGIRQSTGNIIKGHMAENENEICGGESFFRQLGVEPVIGKGVKIDYRIGGEGKIQTKEFTISGLLSEKDISGLGISESRMSYSAVISDKLADSWIDEADRRYSANIRVYGESELDYDGITEVIDNVAKDIGCTKDDIVYNSSYLYTMTDPGSDTIGIAAAIAALIVVFSGLVIYSICYVGVITDVQEIGKLRALGASPRQIKKLMLREGMIISAAAAPLGLIIGYLIPRLLLPVVMRWGAARTPLMSEAGDIHMFSIPVTVGAVCVVALTVYISMLKPMRTASRISPVEAIRYQESASRRSTRKGFSDVNVFRLSLANLTGNRKRTVVTMVTMALSCVLFMSIAGVMNSMSAEDIANRELAGSDFKLTIDYSLNDKEYPENNLENINSSGVFGQNLVNKIESLEGVKNVRCEYTVPVSSDYPSPMFEDGKHCSISVLTREKAEEYSNAEYIHEVKRGHIDYDRMVAENGAVFTGDFFWDELCLKLNDKMNLTVYDGNREIPMNIRVQASLDDGSAPSDIMIPQECFDRLGLQNNCITRMFIDVEKSSFDDVKAALQEISESDDLFELFSRDEEMNVGEMSVSLVKYPMYAVLILIAVIGFMNLINTMITSIITRKRELGMLQAVGLSEKQMNRMLAGEGMVFTAFTMIASITVGNLLGYLIFLKGRDSGFMSVTQYHYPVWETVGLAAVLIIGQLLITYIINRRACRESIIDRIRGSE